MKEKNKKWEILPDGIRLELEIDPEGEKWGFPAYEQIIETLTGLGYVSPVPKEERNDPILSFQECIELKPFQLKYHGSRNYWMIEMAKDYKWDPDSYTPKENPGVYFETPELPQLHNEKDWSTFWKSKGYSGKVVSLMDHWKKIHFDFIRTHLTDNHSNRGRNPNSLANLKNQGNRN